MSILEIEDCSRQMKTERIESKLKTRLDDVENIRTTNSPMK